MYGNSLSVWRIGKVTYRGYCFKAVLHDTKRKLKMVWTLIRPRWRFSLGVEERRGTRGVQGVQQSRPNLKHRFAAQGVFRLDTQGRQGRLYTVTHYYTKPSIWHCSLLGSSVLQGKSLTALMLAGEQSETLGFIIQVTPKELQISQPSCCQLVYPTGDVMWWSTGRLVGG